MIEIVITHIVTNLIKQLVAFGYEEYKKTKGVKDQLNSLENELKFMKKFLRNSVGKQQENGLVGELMEQFKETALEVEDIIEFSILSMEDQRRKSATGKIFHSPFYAKKLHEVSEEVHRIKTSIKEIFANRERYGIGNGEGYMNLHLEATIQRRRRDVDEKVVGFKDVTNMLLQQLIEGSNRREIVSLVGMGGLGKTTIAKRLYNLATIKIHYKNRAWVSVSEDYDTREVILTILNQFKHQAHDLKKHNTQELKNTLWGYLSKNKYLIFLDDVWHKELWDEVKACIPDMRNRSRILITTRDATVARHASPKKPCLLRFLKPEESWELFEKKVFRGDPCSLDLKSLGLEIVEKCKGLPLSIVVIASMLASQERSTWIWKRTLADVSVPLVKDEACLAILALSYRNLPLLLRPCFLYFAVFPEDYEISVQGLIALWLAEGFIQPHGALSLEVVAEMYLDELIDRSLVQVGNRRIDGKVKTCRIHDLVRDLCIEEAKGENFLWIASRITKCSFATKNIKPRRLSIQQQAQGMTQFGNWDPSSVRSFINFDFRTKSISKPFWKTMCSEYKLLRVLDLGESRGVEYNNFSNLVNLRYLRLFLSSKTIPNSIFKLWNLQMLFIEGGQTFNVSLRLLLDLKHLQQLVIGKGGKGHKISGNQNSRLPEKQLQFLQVLSTTHHSIHLENAIENGLCPNLRKLVVYGSEKGWSLEKYFGGLRYLQVLKISSSNSNVKQDIFRRISRYDIPTTLTKITINSSNLSDASMSMLGKFPNLSTLKIVSLTHVKLIAPEGSFPKLNALHLDTVSSGEVQFFRNIQLQQLVVKRCTCDFDECIFTLPRLRVIDISCPSPRLKLLLDKLKLENRIGTECRLIVH